MGSVALSAIDYGRKLRFRRGERCASEFLHYFCSFRQYLQKPKVLSALHESSYFEGVPLSRICGHCKASDTICDHTKGALLTALRKTIGPCGSCSSGPGAYQPKAKQGLVGGLLVVIVGLLDMTVGLLVGTVGLLVVTGGLLVVSDSWVACRDSRTACRDGRAVVRDSAAACRDGRAACRTSALGSPAP